jgi:hypothetical protein
MSLSPTQLTLRDLRGDGWTAEVVERWNPHARVRQDLYGVIDVLAVRGPDTLGVQATSAANVSARVRKIAESPHVGALREAGWLLEVWGWRKKNNRWECRKVDVS